MSDDEWQTVPRKSGHHNAGSKRRDRRGSRRKSMMDQGAAESKLEKKHEPSKPMLRRPSRKADTSSSEDDNDESLETSQDVTFLNHMSVLINCPLPECSSVAPFTDTAIITQHLRDEHHVIFKDLHHMFVTLEQYLYRWSKELQSSSWADHGVKDEDNPDVYVISPSTCDLDRNIRLEIQQEKLKEILKAQQMEREKDAPLSRKCLFCKTICETRFVLFKHMFHEHGFNIGLPDNLVYTNEFLEILEGQLASLRCLFCEKTFTSSTVLRKHMRKKKHLKISPKNRRYDRFYVINYLEPGASWEKFEKEKNIKDDGPSDEDWDDWQEVEAEPTMCLFDDQVLDSPKSALDHMKEAHQFDLSALRNDQHLDFYQTIVLINYIRHQSSLNTCFACNETVQDFSLLAPHLKSKGCLKTPLPLTADFWKDPRYLLPTYENDPLLTGFDAEDESDSEEDNREPSSTQDKAVPTLADHP